MINHYAVFIELFSKWNQRINLSAASTRAEVEEHVEDSLHVVEHLRGLGSQRVLDVGSGGGFPVVVAAMSLPEVAFVALEPVHKKHAFLRTAARELGLANFEARAERLEDHIARDYDAAMSRATFDLVEWLARGLERVRVGGSVLGFEGVERGDLPAGTVRHPYLLRGKSRAIVIATRS
jgi:16S rRNA (guanine527-N7)-methyltransferase